MTQELMIALLVPETIDPQEIIKAIYAHYCFRLADEKSDGYIVIIQKGYEQYSVTREDLFADTLDPIRSKAKKLWGNVKLISSWQKDNRIILCFDGKITREEWYASPEFIKLRFLNNIAAAITHQVQEFNDILQLIIAEKPELTVYDKFSLVERQSRIVSLEASKLWDRARDLADKLTPKLDDPCLTK